MLELAHQTVARNSASDQIGYQLFSHGALGQVHIDAHRLMDSGHIELGHKTLGNWLENHQGTGSEWAHLHFHMAQFELGLGQWQRAYWRFRSEILPIASTTKEALTDAPALLWQLACKAPEGIDLPWEPLRRTALDSMEEQNTPYIDAHNLLALAGAQDAGSLEIWIKSRSRSNRAAQAENLLYAMARALQSHINGKYVEAERLLRSMAPRLSDIGGSHVQQQILNEIRQCCLRQVASANHGLFLN